MDKENKKAMRASFEDVMRLDQSIQHLAHYEVTKGKMVIPQSMEEMVELQTKIAEKFNYFKHLIQNGECSFDFIKNSVLLRNGAFPRNQKAVDFSDTPLLNSSNTDTQDVNEIRGTSASLVKTLIDSIFPGAKIEKIECVKAKELPAHKVKAIKEKPKKKSNKKK